MKEWFKKVAKARVNIGVAGEIQLTLITLILASLTFLGFLHEGVLFTVFLVETTLYFYGKRVLKKELENVGT